MNTELIKNNITNLTNELDNGNSKEVCAIALQIAHAVITSSDYSYSKMSSDELRSLYVNYAGVGKAIVRIFEDLQPFFHVHDELKQIEIRLQDVTEEIRKMIEESDVIEEKNKDLLNKKEELLATQHQLQTQKKEIDQLIELKNGELERKESEVTRLKAILEGLNKEIQEVSRQYDRMQAAFSENRFLVSHLPDQYGTTGEVDDQIHSMKENLKEKIAEFDSLSAEIEGGISELVNQMSASFETIKVMES